MEAALLMLLGLEAKHFAADYVLQFSWMIRDKGNLGKLGGYAHAGMHVLGSLIVWLLFGISLPTIAMLVLVEFVIHYLLDYAKVHYGSGISSSERPHAFWSLNGLDQFFHHVTYLGLTFVALGGAAA